VKLKQFAVIALATFAGFGMVVQDAEAKRLGSGRSLGMSRDAGTMKQATPSKPVAPAQNAAPAAPATAGAAVPPKPASAMSRWMGPLAGLAAGLGIAALMSHLGMGEGMGNFLMIALLVMAVVFVVRMVMAKRAAQSGLQYAGAGNADATRFDSNVSRFDAQKVGADTTAAATGSSAATASVPAGFDVDGFVRQAKLNFVRLQAANDRGDMDDVKEFTSPEMFAEIQMQYQERGKSAQQTDVIELNADLIEVVTEATRHVASVRFHGQLRETANAAPEAFDEVWHLAKPTDGTRGWLVAGIQQL
jgi:predicted lipid-binding transport protein (Tim44 family)